MENSLGFEARPFIARTGFFYVVIVAFLSLPVHPQPQGWDVNSFRCINNSRSALLDATVGANDCLVLPIAIATALTLRYPKPYVYIPAFVWAAFVGYGRIYMGLHYPSDVLAGAILGSASAFAIHLITPQITRWHEKILGDDLGVQLTASPVPTLVNLKISF